MAEEPEATRKKFKIVTNAKEAEQHFHFPKQPVAPNSNIQKQKVKVEGGSSIMILALIIVFAIVIFAVLSLKSNGELPRPSPTVTDARTNSPPHDTESPQPQPVDYVRQVLPTINNEPLLIKSTEKATRAQYENNAVICDAWKDLQRLPNSKWVGIRAIVNRYLNEVSIIYKKAATHLAAKIISKKQQGSEMWLMVQTPEAKTTDPAKTVSTLWVLHEKNGRWRTQAFYYQVPSHKSKIVKTTLKLKYNLQ